jgi:BirA family biotin operon repressor/biotin-[acetyl-CoA-carboxylase] ligase
MKSTPALAPLDIAALRRARAGTHLGAAIHYFESTDSALTVAHELAHAGAEEGTTVIAETQTKGRGRLGRSWISPPFQNLYLAIVLCPDIAADAASLLTLVAGVAAAETVSEWVPRAAIKWPNDVLIDGRKVAGTLTEMETDGDRVRFVVLGMGVNLNGAAKDFPKDLRDKATSLRVAARRPIDRVVFADRLLSRLEEHYDLFLRAGFAAVRPLWEARSCLTGREVTIDEGGQRQTGTVTGIADDGRLLLRTAAGVESRIVAGVVTVVDGYGLSKSSATTPRSKKGKGAADS